MILSGTASGVIGASYVARDLRHRALHEPRYRRHQRGRRGHHRRPAAIWRRRADRRVPDLHPVGLGQSRSARAAARSPGSTPRASSRSGRKAPARGPARPATAAAGRGRRSPTPSWRSAWSGLSELGYSAVTIDRAAARRVVGELAERARAHDRDRPPRRSSTSPYRACIPTSARWFRASASTRANSRCLAFGGAGPMMACFLARELGMQEVVVPTDARRAERARRPDRRPQERLHQDALCSTSTPRRPPSSATEFASSARRRARMAAARPGLRR